MNKWFSILGLTTGILLVGSCVEGANSTKSGSKRTIAANHVTVIARKGAVTSRAAYGDIHAQFAAPTSQKVVARLGVVALKGASIWGRYNGKVCQFCKCPQGSYIAIMGEAQGWYGVLMADGRIGYIQKSNIRLLEYDVVGGSEIAQDREQRVIQTALRYLGIPYQWGGTTARGIDCSAFVRAVFRSNGVYLPRTAREQAQVGTPIDGSQIQPGDRIYFACKHSRVDHAGIYIGNNYFIHASGGRGKVAIDSVFNKRFYNSLVAIRRS